jgi:membrane peptidoglycan carboxypeptidase
LTVVALFATALLGSAVGYELVLPGVGTAPEMVAAIVRAHHGELGRLPLPKKLAASIVAVEDEHFFTNIFLNVLDGVARAAVASLEHRGDPGGSTIAQQLAKQLFPRPPGFATSLEDFALGIKLSLAYSKSKILQMYLNAIYYGNGYWGDVAAAHGYFGVSPDRLSWAEAAMLAGLPQAPSAYDPLHHLSLAKRRQHHVLAQLVADHVLTATQAAAAFRVPLPLRVPLRSGSRYRSGSRCRSGERASGEPAVRGGDPVTVPRHLPSI